MSISLYSKVSTVLAEIQRCESTNRRVAMEKPRSLKLHQREHTINSYSANHVDRRVQWETGLSYMAKIYMMARNHHVWRHSGKDRPDTLTSFLARTASNHGIYSFEVHTVYSKFGSDNGACVGLFSAEVVLRTSYFVS